MLEGSGGVLLVDDDRVYLHAMERLLDGAGIGPVTAHDQGLGAIEKVEILRPDVVCLDLDLGGFDGRSLISKLRSGWPDMGIVVVSGVVGSDVVDDCRKAGVSDYLRKPFKPASFLDVLRKYRPVGADAPGSACADAADFGAGEGDQAFASMLTCSSCMEDVFRYAAAVAPSSLPILVTGETGTGKELMAKALHQLRLSDGPFVAINTAGLDDSMFSDALFGHVAGAFTGGEKTRPGLVESAGEGTLFLDEIGDLSPASQVKLLRLLQENEYFPVGADRPRRSRCRFVLATHKDIGEDPSFRKDLYWRLCSHRVHLPALRERPADVELLARHFVAEASREMRRSEPAIGDGFLRELRGRSFPGNIRELRGFVYDQVARCGGPMLGSTAMRVEAAPRPAGAAGAVFPTLAELQAHHISSALAKTDGNRTAAAEMLGITRQTLIAHLKRETALRMLQDPQRDLFSEGT